MSTYEVVDMGEVYEGIDLKLKAYGNNVEKLFCVKPGANPEQIKIRLSGMQPPDSPFIKGEYRRPGGDVFTNSPLEKEARGLWVNEAGQLVAETELGPVKFTKPVAYQEIDGKRVYVGVAYQIENCKIQNQTRTRITDIRLHRRLLRQNQRPHHRPPACIHVPGRV